MTGKTHHKLRDNAIVIIGALLLTASPIVPMSIFNADSYYVYIEGTPNDVLQAIYEGDDANRVWVKDIKVIPRNLSPCETDPYSEYDYIVRFSIRWADVECVRISQFLDQFDIEYYIPSCD